MVSETDNDSDFDKKLPSANKRMLGSSKLLKTFGVFSLKHGNGARRHIFMPRKGNTSEFRNKMSSCWLEGFNPPHQ